MEGSGSAKVISRQVESYPGHPQLTCNQPHPGSTSVQEFIVWLFVLQSFHCELVTTAYDKNKVMTLFQMQYFFLEFNTYSYRFPLILLQLIMHFIAISPFFMCTLLAGLRFVCIKN